MNPLLLCAQNKDPEAFVALIKLYGQDLYKVAKGFFRDEFDVSDVMQDTVLACYERIQELKQPQSEKETQNHLRRRAARTGCK